MRDKDALARRIASILMALVAGPFVGFFFGAALGASLGLGHNAGALAFLLIPIGVIATGMATSFVITWVINSRERNFQSTKNEEDSA